MTALPAWVGPAIIGGSSLLGSLKGGGSSSRRPNPTITGPLDPGMFNQFQTPYQVIPTTSVTNQHQGGITAPHPFTMAAMQSLLGAAAPMIGNPQQAYPGNLVAPQSPDTMASRDMLRQLVASPSSYAGSGLANAAAQAALGPGAQQDIMNARGTLNFLASPELLNPTTNPHLMASALAGARGATNTFQRNVMPSLRGGAVTAGGFGGSRQGIAEGLAAGEASQAIMDSFANTFNNAYQQGLNTNLAAAQALPGLAGQQLQNISNALSMRGAANEQTLRLQQMLNAQGMGMDAYNQSRIDAEIARWMFNQKAPWDALNAYAGLFSVLPFGGGTSFNFGNSRTVSDQILPGMIFPPWLTDEEPKINDQRNSNSDDSANSTSDKTTTDSRYPRVSDK